MKNCFIPIDGADTIGASSYFLSIDGNRILFDCGSRTNGIEKYPKYCKLYDYLDEPNRLDMVILSHAHFDHIGSLPYVSDKVLKNTTFLSTKTTKELTRLQLLDMNRGCRVSESEKIEKMKRMKAEQAIDRIREIPIMKKQKLKNAEITFIPAGHMPGAAMTYIETSKHKVLYTGDFSFKTQNNINNIKLDSLKPDVLIMNATHGYRGYGFSREYGDLIYDINAYLKRNENVLVSSKSIPKYLDLFYLINNSSIEGDVYLSLDNETIANALENLGYNVYSSKISGYKEMRNMPHVLIGETTNDIKQYKKINIDNYSLHASFEELERMVEILEPKKVFVVHSQPRNTTNNIVDNMKRNNIDIIQCCNEELYEF